MMALMTEVEVFVIAGEKKMREYVCFIKEIQGYLWQETLA